MNQTFSDIDVTIIPPGDNRGITIFRDDNGHARDVVVPETDVIVMQRTALQLIVEAIPLIRAKGIAVVIDVDDDLSHIDPTNPAFSLLHPNPRLDMETPQVQQAFLEAAKKSRMHPLDYYEMHKRKFMRPSWKHVEEACKRATLTTVSTPALLNVYGGGRARVIHNYVPKSMLEVPRTDNNVVGWAGSTFSHPGDLRALGGGLPRDATFMIVGQGTNAHRELGLIEPVSDTGPIEFGVWPSAVVQIGIGVAPLLDTRFNRAKSWLKPLEYAAVGVPWVASPRAEYSALHAMGMGFLAEKPKEWNRILRRLIDDEAFRLEQSDQVRAVAATMTIEEHAWRWAEVWAEAVSLQRSTSAVATASSS